MICTHAPRNVRFRQIVNVESVILDPVAGVLGGVDLDMVLRSVEHVGHPDPLEIVHVADRVTVADDDAVMDLVAVDAEMPPFIVITGRLESRQWPVFPRPRVHDRVDQLVPRSLSGDRGGFQSQVSRNRKFKYRSKFPEVTGEAFHASLTTMNKNRNAFFVSQNVYMFKTLSSLLIDTRVR